MSTAMSEYRDWTITIPFTVPVGDTEGIMTEAVFEAALEHAPSQAKGITARADTSLGKVWIVFTLTETSQDLANSIGQEMRERVQEAVVSSDEACVTGS
jgi:hypothetical protein